MNIISKAFLACDMFNCIKNNCGQVETTQHANEWLWSVENKYLCNKDLCALCAYVRRCLMHTKLMSFYYAAAVFTLVSNIVCKQGLKDKETCMAKVVSILQFLESWRHYNVLIKSKVAWFLHKSLYTVLHPFAHIESSFLSMYFCCCLSPHPVDIPIPEQAAVGFRECGWSLMEEVFLPAGEPGHGKVLQYLHGAGRLCRDLCGALHHLLQHHQVGQPMII